MSERTGPTSRTRSTRRASVEEMFDQIANRYELVNTVMTFGLDRRWRRRTVEALALPVGSSVLDVACGTGDLCHVLRRAQLVPTGVDSSANMLANAEIGLTLVRGDAQQLGVASSSFDGATCGFGLRNFTDVGEFLAELRRVVRPGGRIALLEVDTPTTAALRAIHGFYFGKVVPKVGAVLSDAPAYRYLPESVVYLPAADELAQLLVANGFVGFTKTRLGAGAIQLITATRAP